jgi:hypothetical protein
VEAKLNVQLLSLMARDGVNSILAR